MIHYNIYKSSKNVPQAWNSLVEHDVFLQTTYLKALEEASPNNIQWFYILVYSDNKVAGIAVIQNVQLYLKDIFRKTAVSCIKSFFKDLVSKTIKGNILVVGNITHTGQHGLFFLKDHITQPRFLETIIKALDDIKQQIYLNKKKKIRAIMLKDYFETDSIYSSNKLFAAMRFHKVVVQPNMIFYLKQEWLTIEDYVSTLNKKYRDQYKRARKKRAFITTTELTLDEIKYHTPLLYKLYNNVTKNAKFNTFYLPENHFFILKKQLKENFKVYGYFYKNQIVGFHTLILNNTTLETYFLGYDKEHQQNNLLYLNMLYDMLSFAITNKFKTIIYARTAMEIKSSVGAKATPMFIYLKHTNGLLNVLLKPIFKFMNPKQNWSERHPFK